MATLITRADGNFTDAATWGTAATGGSGANACLIDSEATTGSILTNTTNDSSTFVLPATAVDGVAFKLAAITAMTGTWVVSLRNSTLPGTRDASVTIDPSVIPTNFRGWLLVPFSSFTPNGTDSYVVRIVFNAGGTGNATTHVLSGSNISRIIRTTTTAAPASGDQLVMCGEYAGSTTVNLRTVTMDNTATTTFGAVVATYPQAISINDKATLDWATTASTNFYLRFKGIFRVQARGILQMYTATSGAGSLPSTSTAVLEMDCTAAGDSAIQLGGTTAALTGGTWTLNGQARGTSGSITGATNATPIEITDTAHGYETGAGVVISGVGGNTAANGTWWITKTGANTYTLDNSAGNGSYTSGGTRVSRLASKMQTTTDINTDTISMGSIVNTATNVVTWKEGQKFDTGWTGLVTINGTVYTISSVTNTTQIILTISIGTVSGATFTKLGTGAPVTMNLADNSFLATDDVIGTGTSSNRPADGNVALISSVGSSGQITLKGPPCEYIVSVTNGSTAVTLSRGQAPLTTSLNSTTATIDGNSVTISSNTAYTFTLSANYAGTTNSLARLQTAQTAKANNSAYLSGLNDANGDVRAEAFLITRNVMVRSLGQVGNINGLFGLIQIGSTDAVVNWNYGEFSQLGSGSSSTVGIYLLITTGTFNVRFCTIRDFWQTSCGWTIGSASITCDISNNFLHNIQGNTGVPFSSTNNSGVVTFSGNIFHLGTWGCLLDSESIVTYNTFICSSQYGITFLYAGQFSNVSHNTFHGCTHAYRTTISTAYGEIKKSIIWRLSSSNTNGIFLNTTNTNMITLTDLVAFGIGTTGQNGSIIYVQSGNVTLIRPIFNSGVNINNGAAIGANGGGGQLIIYDGQIGVTSAFNYNILISSAMTAQIQTYNTTWGSGSYGSNSPVSIPGYSAVSIKHNGVSGDNRAWISSGTINSTGAVATDTTIYNTVLPSLRCYPGLATFKIQVGPFYIPVKSGINPKISIAVRKSVVGDGTAYNGNQPRLILLVNSALGYSYDATLGYNLYSSVLATSSGAAGSWETLTATLPTTPTEDGVVSVVVDLDGTAGWVNIDDFYVDSPNTGGMKNWAGDFAGPLVAGVIEPIVVKRRRKAR